METNEIMATEMVEDITEFDVVEPCNSGKKLAVGLGIGAAVALGTGLAFKFLVKPILKKRKAAKEAAEYDTYYDDEAADVIDVVE